MELHDICIFSLEHILSIFGIVFGTGGSILTLYTIKLIKVDSIAPFTEVAAYLSKDADPTPAIRRKKLYDPHNKKIMRRFKTGIAFIILGAILQIVSILFF
nr:MAG TPA: hypothetical protein [Bacteriophage sp.]